MLVKDIHLTNYRNYTNASFNLEPTLNIIIGDNGIGKTNILESIVVVSNTKSFRTVKDQELIQKEKDYARIEINSDNNNYKVVVNQNGKSLFINNNSINKTSEFIGKLNAVLFKPSDLELFNTSPKERRRLLDVELGKISKIYLDSLFTYSKLLKDKNHLLKENKIDETYLNLLDEQMLPCMKIIIQEREKLFEKLNSIITSIYQKLSGTDTNIQIVYEKCSEIENLKNECEKSKEKDKLYHYATFGPHHDDYYFNFNGYELNSIASQGQKRMVFISLKLALISYIKEVIQENPIILLDDVLSELDIENRNRLLNILPSDAQIIITDTDLKGIQTNTNYKLIELKERY